MYFDCSALGTHPHETAVRAPVLAFSPPSISMNTFSFCTADADRPVRDEPRSPPVPFKLGGGSCLEILVPACDRCIRSHHYPCRRKPCVPPRSLTDQPRLDSFAVMVLPSSFRYPMRSIRDQQQQCNAERLFSDSLWTCSIGTRRRESQGTMLRYIAGTQAIVSLVLPACCRAPLRGASDLVACVACDSRFGCRYRPHKPTWSGSTAPDVA